MRVSLVVGTRPQIIKSQPLIKKLLSNNVNVNIVHTGQHYDFELSKSFFDEMKIKDPDYNLGIKTGSPSSQLEQIILKLEKPLKSWKPDIVLVPGDTRSALGAFLGASRLGFKTAHIEAGARSNELDMEEEINRRLIDSSANLLFAPTKNCYKNLKKESVFGNAYFTGDTMFDVFLEFKKILNLQKSNKQKFILMTIHRKKNIENYTKIKKIIQLAKKISKYEQVVFPIHPHTERQIKSFGISLSGICTIKPVKYSKILQLLSDASLLITDSGGLQKEAYWLNTPCVTLRKSTEWIETFQGKHNILLNDIKKSSLNIIKNMIKQKHPFDQKSVAAKFGNGLASKKITSILLHNL